MSKRWADLATKFHETWLGMVQPIDGLVVSGAGCRCWSTRSAWSGSRRRRRPPHVALQLEQFRAKLGELAPEAEQAAMTIAEEMRRAGRTEGHTQVLRKLLALKFGALRPSTRLACRPPRQRSSTAGSSAC